MLNTLGIYSPATIILFGAFTFTFGQKPVKCEISKETYPNYKIVDWSRGQSKLASIPQTLDLKAIIKSKDVVDENLTLLTRHFKEIYCNEIRFTVLIFDSKKAATEYSIYQEVKGLPRAIYSIDRARNKEKLEKLTLNQNKIKSTEIKLPE